MGTTFGQCYLIYILSITIKGIMGSFDRGRLIAIHDEGNREWGMPKITTFAHTEHGDRFGCGAGNQHSYIDADGGLAACDFVPMRFGNVRDTPFHELWPTMRDAIGMPKQHCFARTLNKELAGGTHGSLPLSKETACTICRRHQEKSYPGVYRQLQELID